MARGLPILLLTALACSAAAAAPEAVAPADTTGTPAVEAHLAAPDLHRLDLRFGLLVPGSFQAEVDGRPWTADTDFRLDEREGVWLPLRPLGPADGGPVTVVLSYRHAGVPAPLRAELHPLRTAPPPRAAAADTAADRAAADAPALPGDLDVRGSKTVRMASGNRRELVVDQNLRLNISGHLTEDIAVEATLSDDNLPVVPEGNTEELRDIDRVRVDVTAPTWNAVLGDFVAVQGGSEFGRYRRKLQGVQVDAGRGRPVGMEVLAGAPRGRFRTVTVRGQEANQGPYDLGAGAGARLFVVAGSERVFLDGEAMTRGDDRDYVIDYVRGTVTFTFRRLITADSEIVVEYEEGEGPYARSVAGAAADVSGRLPGLGAAARARVGLIRERDDATRPRSGELTDADRTVLEAAGDDPALAVADGLTPTAVGEGAYRLDEIGGVSVAVWDSLQGDHQVQFYQAGAGLGDYAVQRLTETGATVYVYRGPGGGSWRIGRPLELPESRSLMTAAVALGDTMRPWLSAEWHAGAVDANTLSARDDGDDGAVAWRAAAASGPRDVRWGGRGLGRVRGAVVHEDLAAGFEPFTRVRDAFRYERWGLADRAAREGFLLESDRETRGELAWEAGGERRRAGVAVGWNRLRHGGSLEASERSLEGTWAAAGLAGRHQARRADARDTADPLDVDRREDRHELAVTAGPLRPSAAWDAEEYADAAHAAPSAAGARLERLRLDLAGRPNAAWAWRLGWTRDQADSLRTDGWARERDGRTWTWRLGSPAVGGVRLTADGSWRRVAVPDGADRTTRLAKLRLTGRWDDLGSDWGLSYGVDNSRTEVLDRQVVYVGLQQGDYNQAGDFVGTNLGEFNVVTVGTDSLVATTEVAADLTWRQDFGFLGRDRLWGAWNTFTRVGARGRSRTDDTGGLLRLERDRLLDPDDGVLGELSLRQEAVLLRNLRTWDLRLTLDFSEVLDRQYAAHPEHRLRRMHEAQLTHNPTPLLSLRWRGRRETDARRTEESSYSSNRSYDTVVRRHELEAVVRPSAGNQYGLTLDRLTRDDAVTTVRQTEWGLKPGARWQLARRWSGQAEVRWSRVDSEEPAGALRPFFFPDAGVNVDMTTRVSWDPSSSMTVTLSHASRRLGDARGWRHDVRLESTARF
ncbi:MAG TPA: hypothetical protein P5571_04815 [Candidatus Krumholzibacteria bacterium]|nr:hypothetical protein [Candidatus Krumholzibacteria bacterium]HRX50664.1 hypothetical protein [Candidatus Krumholzibacteria bacterium]